MEIKIRDIRNAPLNSGPDRLLDRLDVACRLLTLYGERRAVDRLGLCRSLLHVAEWQQMREPRPDLEAGFGFSDPRESWADAYYCGGAVTRDRLSRADGN